MSKYWNKNTTEEDRAVFHCSLLASTLGSAILLWLKMIGGINWWWIVVLPLLPWIVGFILILLIMFALAIDREWHRKERS